MVINVKGSRTSELMRCRKTVGYTVALTGQNKNLNFNFKRFDHFDDLNFTVVFKDIATLTCTLPLDLT